MSDLPSDIEEEVLSRLPVTSLGKLRLTCKKWNTLTKDESFLKKQRKKGTEMVMMLGHKVSLMSFDLLNSLSIERIGNLNADGVYISEVIHCEGLFLCITTKDKEDDSSSLFVLNPLLGQTKWIEPMKSCCQICENYAFGYDKEEKIHKILRFVNEYYSNGNRVCEFGVYSLQNSSSWKVVDDFAPDWSISYNHSGLSLKGNTYWYAQERNRPGRIPQNNPDFLLSFDFTTERFGPRLPLPFHASFEDTVTLSSVREEQLVVLFHNFYASFIKIWITNKIEPNAVSWDNLFLDVDLERVGICLQVSSFAGSFFVDEEKKVAVVLYKEREYVGSLTSNIVYVIGNKRCFKVNLGESLDKGYRPFVCSYVPSLVRIRNTA
ncbi:hypothetical protein CARUB_v10002576mg [Capsella rubella]|uniref:F-box domain-containing protein n=2 Tax=Capsella rubella TaxID=81985 RepID=R0H4F7_9BRAS|nr:hypothetical protein CARUB_v10002576mg [Capsella rubella]